MSSSERTVILLGGPPGVGKTTVLSRLVNALPHCVGVDADDVRPPSRAPSTAQGRRAAVEEVTTVVRGHFDAGARLVVLSWVFARAELYQPVLEDLSGVVDQAHLLYLVASAAAIEQRLAERGDLPLLEYALSRLLLIERLPFRRIDCTLLTAQATTERVIEEIRRWTFDGAWP